MDPTFEVETDARAPTGETLVVGVSNLGMAGLTAADYLVEDLECEEIGHVAAHGYPSVTPFAEGEPRHHTRLYDVPGQNMTVLMSELFVPVAYSEAFVDGLLDWTVREGFEELVVFNGVPFPHGPDEHEVFHVSTEAYRERRIPDGEYEPLKGGYFDGIVGELLTLSLNGTLPPTGTFVTPTHPPGPDLDAALLFVEVLQSVYGVPIDPAELESRSDELERHYAQLADRVQANAEAARDYSEDRAYM